MAGGVGPGRGLPLQPGRAGGAAAPPALPDPSAGGERGGGHGLPVPSDQPHQAGHPPPVGQRCERRGGGGAGASGRRGGQRGAGDPEHRLLPQRSGRHRPVCLGGQCDPGGLRGLSGPHPPGVRRLRRAQNGGGVPAVRRAKVCGQPGGGRAAFAGRDPARRRAAGHADRRPGRAAVPDPHSQLPARALPLCGAAERAALWGGAGGQRCGCGGRPAGDHQKAGGQDRREDSEGRQLCHPAPGHWGGDHRPGAEDHPAEKPGGEGPHRRAERSAGPQPGAGGAGGQLRLGQEHAGHYRRLSGQVRFQRGVRHGKAVQRRAGRRPAGEQAPHEKRGLCQTVRDDVPTFAGLRPPAGALHGQNAGRAGALRPL